MTDVGGSMAGEKRSVRRTTVTEVSAMTVSNVLNGPHRVSEPTYGPCRLLLGGLVKSAAVTGYGVYVTTTTEGATEIALYGS